MSRASFPQENCRGGSEKKCDEKAASDQNLQLTLLQLRRLEHEREALKKSLKRQSLQLHQLYAKYEELKKEEYTFGSASGSSTVLVALSD
ncbi:hypothetical protein L0F63_004024 [Massospora cicadina]|nr:hypothetical protein L0F63_004024 [Massospora cicadina]